VYLLAAERNSNLVKLTTYAPILQNRNSYVWTPNLISFEAQQNRTVLSTSYWLQTLFNRYRGDSTVEVRGEVNPLFWVGSVDNSTQAMYLKVSTVLRSARAETS
jgi:alpha-N-arabinofuranosidase